MSVHRDRRVEWAFNAHPLKVAKSEPECRSSHAVKIAKPTPEYRAPTKQLFPVSAKTKPRNVEANRVGQARRAQSRREHRSVWKSYTTAKNAATERQRNNLG